MATIRENLKNGIDKKDWKLIIIAYEALTGEKINVQPEEESYITTTKKKKKSKIILPDDDDDDDYEEEEYHRPRRPRVIERDIDRDDKQGRRKKLCVPEQIDLSKSKFNTFVDNKTEATDLIKIDRKLAKKPKAPRVREDFSNVNVECSRCYHVCEVHPQLAKRNFVCDKCIGRS